MKSSRNALTLIASLVPAAAVIVLGAGVWWLLRAPATSQQVQISQPTPAAPPASASTPAVSTNPQLAFAARNVALAGVSKVGGASADAFSSASSDRRLSAWLAEWRKTARPGRQATDVQRAELEQILAARKLSCQNLLDIGKGINVYSSDDLTTAYFFRAAITQGDRELADCAPGSEESRPILVAMNSTKPLLWRVIDGGDRRFLDALWVLNNDLVKWISSNDAALSNARLHGYVGIAECLYATNRTEEAIKASEAIDTRNLDDDQRVAVAYIRGLSLFDAKRYAEALPELQIAAERVEGWQHQPDARGVYILALCYENKIPEAEAEYHRLTQSGKQAMFQGQCRLTLNALERRPHQRNPVNDSMPKGGA